MLRRKIVACSGAVMVMTAPIAPALAGGWGKGPSWSQAVKIVHQAATDAQNGIDAVKKDPTVQAIVVIGGVVVWCAATDGTCIATLPAAAAP